MSSREAMAVVLRDWNAFKLKNWTFELGVSYWAEDGKQYDMCVTTLTKYAYHRDNPRLRTFNNVTENRYFSQRYWLFFAEIFVQTYLCPWQHRSGNAWFEEKLIGWGDLTDETLSKKRAEASKTLAKLHLSVLQREAELDREWRIMWDARRDHVRRALFAFFKGQAIDTRKQIYMLFRKFWLAEAQ